MYAVEYYICNKLYKQIFKTLHDATEFCIRKAPFQSVKSFYLVRPGPG